MKKVMTEKDCLAAIAEGRDALDLLLDANPKLSDEFDKLDAHLIKYLAKVRQYFPDAIYYTGSGGFHLLLGSSHNWDTDVAQSQLVAKDGQANISDGDW